MTENNIHNGHPFVDLGLPSGLLWATCNVGATSPEQAGLYFAWGETTGYTAEQVTGCERAFERATYKAKKVKGNITAKQDAARANLGGNWRMPTKDDFLELIDNCTSTWTNDYNGTGVAGRLFTSKINGKSVFLPAAGFCFDSSVGIMGSGGNYWAASPWYSSENAWFLYVGSGNIGNSIFRKFYGHSVRGVCER